MSEAESNQPREPAFAPGELVEINHRGQWFDGRVIRVAAPGLFEVSFAANSAIVGANQLRPAKRESVRAQAGAAVQIAWRSQWWPGRVVRLVSDDLFEISYDGYDASWDEIVGPERVREPPVIAPLDYATLAAGAAVRVFWGSSWYDGRVVRVAGEKQWEISYDGYGESWNEVVGPERLQSPNADASGSVAAARAAPRFEPGTAVSVQYGTRRSLGRVVRAVGEHWEIAYDGFDESWNELVEESHIRPAGAESH